MRTTIQNLVQYSQKILRKDLYAFSLLETGLVLIIVGASLGAILPLINIHRTTQQKENTLKTLDIIEESLLAYYKHYKTLPCPSLTHEEAPDFGEAASGCSNTYQHEGCLPFRSLGLPRRFAKDAYGHWLTYAVDTSFTASKPSPEPLTQSLESILSQRTQPTTTHKKEATILNVFWGEGSQTRIHSLTNDKLNIAYILISHGLSGNGAYTGKGLIRIKNNVYSPLEANNSNGGRTYLDAPYQESPRFTHILRWHALYK